MEDLEMEMGIAMAAGGEAEDMNFLINTTTTSNNADENGDVIGEQISVCDFSEEGIKAKPPPPEPEELLDSEFPDTEDLLNAAEIFDCVNLPAINELQQLPDCSAASISSSSASVSSPSSSWIPKQDPDAASGCCFATERPEDSATSTSLAVREIPDSDCVCYDNNDKIDLLEELRSLELLDGSEDVWDMPDSSCLQAVLQEEPCEAAVAEAPDGDDDSGSGEELPMVFFEWLKSNRDSISPEDLRNIKLKRSTIETAAQHLGGGKKGMLHLLKLILSWVQTYHLQRKRKLRESPPLSSSASSAGPFCYNLNFPVLLESASSSPAPAFACNNDPNIYDPTLLSCDPAALHAPKYRRVPMEEGLRDAGFENPNQICLQSCVGSDLSSWQMAMIAGNSASPGGVSSSSGFCNSTAAGSFMNGRVQHHHLSADFMGFRSATPAASTKEARKNRMARQRRSLAHHHHRPWQSSSSTCSSPAALAVAVSTAMNPHNPSPETVAANGGFPIMQQHFSQRQTAFMPSDRRQGWKPEKNLKFLLQKVLKQSDVGNLGRIVLPKKEAEAELPKLEARDGIPITMEDMTTSRVWSMRYRFWPNNKSRMYLLENTGDFVRSNNLQEGDFIVIFLDTKTGKYMIRGVKVPRSDATAVATTTTTNYSNNNTNSSNKSISSNHNSNSSSSNVICNSNSSGRACSRLPNVAPSKVAKANPSYGASTTQQSRHAIAPMPATAPAPAAATTALSVFADASSASGSHFHLSCNSSIVDPFFTDSSLQTQSQSDPAVSSPQTHDDSVGLERFLSIESEDLTIQEIMDLVDSPEDDDDDKELQAETP